MSFKEICNYIATFIGVYIMALIICTLLFGGKMQFNSLHYETKGLIPYIISKIK